MACVGHVTVVGAIGSDEGTTPRRDNAIRSRPDGTEDARGMNGLGVREPHLHSSSHAPTHSERSIMSRRDDAESGRAPLAAPDSAVRLAGFSDFERVGSGGFSSVYSARQTSLGRRVAVKVLSADLSEPSDRRAFERECQALGLVSHHPNIVTIYNEAFLADGRPCIVMELYGQNYRELLDEAGPLRPADVLSLGVKMSGALHSAHLNGVLHRDLKPHNIFVSSYGEPALGDFGISTLEDERSISATSGLSVAYAAPEVLEDSSATVASDVYSLAATLYHLAAGSAPFASKQMRTTVRRILTEPPAPLPADSSAEVSSVLLRALAKEPEDRFRSAGEFGEALRAVEGALGLQRTTMPLPQGPRVESADVDGAPGRIHAGDPTLRRARDRPVSDGRSSTQPPDGRLEPESIGRLDRSAGGVSGVDEETIQRGRRAASTSGAAVDAGRVRGADGETSAPSERRKRFATVAGVVTVVAVVAGAFALSGGQDAEPAASTTTVIRSIGDDPDFLTPLVVPNDIRVVASDEGMVVVTFTPVPGAVSYEIVSVVPSQPAGRRVAGSDSPVVADVALEDAPCWRLIVLGERSQVSESDTVCGST